ncbi:MAG: branched-chain amino acid ABC transporter permease [Desulfuromonas sp.]|nr:MAG: branched-chain amino acid ABC transporter permease [Desulfuromonas sp.]
MALGSSMRPCGDYRTSYASDATIFATPVTRYLTLGFIALLFCVPLVGSPYVLNLMIQIGYYGIAALGLNLVVGFTGQISLGHSAFFGFGAFASAWMNSRFGIPVFFAIPLAGLLTMLVGLFVGIPAGRIKGLYLAIATLASQFILEDFFARADWFTGGSAGAMAEYLTLFGYALDSDRSYYYLVLVYVLVIFTMTSNLVRTRDGRALVAVRDHYLSAEIMGINLTWYRVMSFGLSALYAGIGGALFGHYLGFVSAEGFTIILSIQFLAMIIIGGLGSIYGTVLGTIFMVLLPEVMTWSVDLFSGMMPDLIQSLAYIKEMAIGLAIILFLIFEPEGLAHRWQRIKAYWKLYPFSY